MTSIFQAMEQGDYEHLFFCQEQSTGLKAIIAIHDTTLGPAAGGIRMKPYATEEEAIRDALRLAQAMTYKCAAAGANLGGGKCVVIGDPQRDKSEALLRVLGRFIRRLNGLFITGMDVGTTLEDMDILRQECPYVTIYSEALGGPGDTAAATALGVVSGMRACLKAVYGDERFQGRHVAVQGVGAVGSHVVELLVQAGALVTIADVDEERVRSVATHEQVTVVAPGEIATLPVDIYCPCALGGVLNQTSIPTLRCAIVCGSANNQLQEEQDGELLEQRGILYAPDYIVNAGGVIVGADSLLPGGYKQQRAEAAVRRLYQAVEQVISLAKEQHVSTNRAAALLARKRIEMMKQVRSVANGADAFTR